MACSSTRSESIADFAAGNLAAEEAEELLAHLMECAPCSDEFDLTADLVRSTPTVAIASEPTRSTRWRLGPALILAAAAALLLIFKIPTQEKATGLRELANLEAPPYPTGILRGEQDEARREAMIPYQAGDFLAAANALQALAARDSKDALTHLYWGLALVQAQRYDDAQAPLDVASEFGDGLVRERALWYLANMALHREDGDQAFMNLNALLGASGPYAAEAEVLLDTLIEMDATLLGRSEETQTR